MNEATQQAILTRDGFKCKHCGFRNNLTVHHIVYRSKGGTDEPSNLVTLCITCHEAIHNKNLKIVDGKFIKLNNWKPV